MGSGRIEGASKIRNDKRKSQREDFYSNLRVRRKNPGRRDHAAAGPFPVRRHLLEADVVDDMAVDRR